MLMNTQNPSQSVMEAATKMSIPTMLGKPDDWNRRLTDEQRAQILALFPIKYTREWSNRLNRFMNIDFLIATKGRQLPWSVREALENLMCEVDECLDVEGEAEDVPCATERETPPAVSGSAIQTEAQQANSTTPVAKEVSANEAQRFADGPDAIPAALAPEAVPTPIAPQAVFRVMAQCPPDMWPAPNALIRSALFSASKAGSQEYERRRIATFSHTTLHASGPSLTQADLDVLLAVIGAARDGDLVQVTSRELLRTMGRGISTRDAEQLRASLQRLSRCEVSVSVAYKGRPSRAWCGRLLRDLQDIQVSTATGGLRRKLELTLDPGLGEFMASDITWMMPRERQSLRQHRLAAGLHAMYVSHRKPLPMTLERVRTLLGVAVKGSDFERLLQEALGLLRRKNLLTGWKITKGKLHVSTRHEPAQEAPEEPQAIS